MGFPIRPRVSRWDTRFATPNEPAFQQLYVEGIKLIPDFFSAARFAKKLPGVKPKIITSIAMFYDLERPMEFVRDIASLLADDGIWHFEQSYMPSMLRMQSYDTICHEHLEFYSFKIVKHMLENAGLRVMDVQMNSINGGSFAVTACKPRAPYKSNAPIVNWMLKQEDAMGLDTPRPYRDFEERVFRPRKDLRELIEALVADGQRIIGYGRAPRGTSCSSSVA